MSADTCTAQAIVQSGIGSFYQFISAVLPRLSFEHLQGFFFFLVLSYLPAKKTRM